MQKEYAIFSIDKGDVLQRIKNDQLIDKDERVKISSENLEKIAEDMRIRLRENLDDSFWEIFQDCLSEAIQEILL